MRLAYSDCESSFAGAHATLFFVCEAMCEVETEIGTRRDGFAFWPLMLLSVAVFRVVVV